MKGKMYFASGRFARRLALVIGVIYTGMMFYILLSSGFEPSAKDFTSWYAILTSMLLAILLLLMLRSHYRKPTKVRVAVFGLPGTGKTTYLHVLYNQLRTYSAPKFLCKLPDEHLVVTLNQSMNMLAKDKWPAPTTELREQYRSLITLGSQFLPERMQVDLVDYSLHNNDRHETEISVRSVNRLGVYRAVNESQGVIMIIDGRALFAGEFVNPEKSLSVYTAMVHDLIRSHKGQATVDIPVALVVTKIDYVEHAIQPAQLIGLINDFTALCRKTFPSFRVFYVTSTGKPTPNGAPPHPLRSRHVLDPFIWMVTHFE